MRLNAIAADRAPTIATTIQRICRSDGSPRAASTAPRNANGNAKSVCSILIISRVSRVFLITVDTVTQILPQKSTQVRPQIFTDESGSYFDYEADMFVCSAYVLFVPFCGMLLLMDLNELAKLLAAYKSGELETTRRCRPHQESSL